MRNQDREKGLSFFSEDQDFLQVGSWWYEKGKKIDPHIHQIFPREAQRTQEFIFVEQGRLRADVYTEKEELLKSVELEKGDLMVFLAGGHGFEILEDDTKVVEAKNGPFLGVDKDKKKFHAEKN